MMANETTGRRLRRSQSSRDQTIRAVYDRDHNSSPATRNDERERYNIHQLRSSPVPPRHGDYQFRYPESAHSNGDASINHQNAFSSPRALHSRIPAPSSTGRGSSRAYPSSPPPYHVSPTAEADSGSNIAIGTDSYMDWEQSPNATETLRVHHRQPFQSSHHYATQERPDTMPYNPLRLNPTVVRPPVSFAYDMMQITNDPTRAQRSTEGGCTCGHNDCPLIHYISPEDYNNATNYRYQAISGTFQRLTPVDLMIAYANADTYTPRPTPNEFQQNWHSREHYTRPFLYDLERTRSERSQQRGRRVPVEEALTGRHHDGQSNDMHMEDVHENSRHHHARRSPPEGPRSPPRQSRGEGNMAMVEIRTPGGMGVRIVEATRRYGNR